MRSIRITERDREVIHEVSRHRVIRRDDLIRLGYFRSVARCNQRLLQLIQAGFLRRLHGINGLTSHQTLYGLGSAPLVHESTDELALEDLERQFVGGEGPILLEHSLRVLDFRHLLNEECRKYEVSLVEWLGEPECLHEFEFRPSPSSAWRTVIIKPDASFELAVDEQSHRFFLEVDLGHVSLPRFRQKLYRYHLYLGSGAFRDAYEPSGFTVLTVTTGERRLDHLSGLHARGFDHVLTTWTRIAATGLIAGDRSHQGSGPSLFNAVQARHGRAAK